MSAKMRAVVCRDWCDYDDLVLDEIDRPVLRPGAVRVGIRYAGVSFATTLVVAGRYQRRPPLPFVPGTEITGEVLEIGPDENKFKIGDPVMAAIDWGGYAQETLVRRENLFPVPAGASLADAVALPISYGTSYGALFWRAALKAGEWLLVHGAAGGVGLAAVELAKAKGATVVALASTADKRAEVARRGADHVIDSLDSNWADAVRTATGGEGVDVVYDSMGGDVFHQSLRLLKAGGRSLTIGFASGAIPELKTNILLLKNISVLGFNWGHYLGWSPVDERSRHAAAVAGVMADLNGLWQDGKIAPTVHRTLPLAAFREAMAEVQGRRAIGRVVLEVGA